MRMEGLLGVASHHGKIMGGQFSKFAQQVAFVSEQTQYPLLRSPEFLRAFGFNLKFDLVLNTKFKGLIKVTYVRVVTVVDGQEGNL